VKYLLDTNVISEFISKNPNQKVVDYVLTLDETNLYLSAITIGEIKAGIEKLDNSRKKETLLQWLEKDLLNRFESKIIPVDTDVILKWGEINNKLKKTRNTFTN